VPAVAVEQVRVLGVPVLGEGAERMVAGGRHSR
jgi:hypothetical protein